MSDKVEDIVSAVQEENVIALTITNILDLTEASKVVIEEDKKSKTYYNAYSGGGWNKRTESDYSTIYFYDFSDTSKQPRTFHRVSEFLKWAEEHKVLISSTKEHELKANTVNFCACKEGSATIVIRTTKYLLDTELKRKSDYNVPCCVGACHDYEYGRYPYDDYGYDDKYINDWD